jgi:D-alanyl-D-alanine carboxypeptidase
LHLGQTLPVSSNAAEQSPSKLGLRAGQRIRVEDAVLGLVTESANDAAVVIAEALGGSEAGFGRLMTQQAHELGMTHTRFDNPSGLPDPEQVTTARDMAMLGHALIYHFPQFYPYFSHDSFMYGGIYHHNHNHLMDRYDGMDGIKTGYIRASGFNGRSATSRDNRMAQLLDESFEQIREERSGQTTARTINDLAQGDSDDAHEGDDYVTLPAKIEASFEPGDEEEVAPAAAPVASPPMRVRATAPAHTSGMVNRSTAGWGIQIGAYSDPDIGRQALARIVNTMPQLLNRADPVMQKVSTGGEAMYRARLMALDQRTAQSVCSWLLQHGQSCMTVQP